MTLKETLTFQGTRDFLRGYWNPVVDVFWGASKLRKVNAGRRVVLGSSREEIRSDALRTETATPWDRQFGVEG